MCGILGHFIFNGDSGRLSSEGAFVEALHLQVHRGPDDWGLKAAIVFVWGIEG